MPVYRTYTQLAAKLHLPGRERRREKLFKHALRPSDVFLVGHPKSGNTWLAFALTLIAHPEAHIRDLRTYIPTIHGADERIAYYEHLLEPRVFRNEWPVFPNLYPKTIYLVRDPRAALLSYYHHYTVLFGGERETADSFVARYVKNKKIEEFEPDLPAWDTHVAEWLKRKETQPVLFVKYEDMKRDFQKVFETVTAFIGLRVPPEIVARIANATTFSAMRKNEESYGAESYPQKKGEEKRFMRKGDIDSWKQELSYESVALIEHAYGPLMQKLGYSLTT